MWYLAAVHNFSLHTSKWEKADLHDIASAFKPAKAGSFPSFVPFNILWKTICIPLSVRDPSNPRLSRVFPSMARGHQKIQSQQKNAKKQAEMKKAKGHDQKTAAKAALVFTCAVCKVGLASKRAENKPS